MWFDDHVENLFIEPFLLYLASPIAEAVFSDPDYYHIDADEMDRRINALAGTTRSNTLVQLVQAFIHKPKSETTESGLEKKTVNNANDTRSIGGMNKSGSRPALSHDAGAFEEGDEETVDRARLRRLEEEADLIFAYSVLERCVQPYCSNATYSAILHKLAEFTCEQLLLEVLGEEATEGKDNRGEGKGTNEDCGDIGGTRRVGGARFSEWGALLFHHEVMATVETFELADERVHSSSCWCSDKMDNQSKDRPLTAKRTQMEV